MVGVYTLVSIALAGGVTFMMNGFVQEMNKMLGHGKQLVFSDAGCQLLQAGTSMEDLSAFGDGHAVFGGGGDLWNAFMNGSEAAKAGAIYLINATEASIKELRIVNKASVPKLILHGIYFSQTSRRLYAVNHNIAHGESVEIFHLLDDGSLDLEHVASVRSDLFQHYALNDVVEGVDGEFYVTEWLPFGWPRGGKHAAESFSEKLTMSLMTPINLLKIPKARVFRCKVDLSPQCEVASALRFVSPNGIAVSSDRGTFYVNDPVMGAVFALSRNRNGQLEYGSEFKPQHMVDNIEVGADGNIYGGSIPIVFTAGAVCDDGLGAQAVLDGRQIGCDSSPGGVLQIEVQSVGATHLVQAGQQTDLVMHDGAKLSGVSAGLKVKSGRTILGSPYSPGALLCKL